MKLIGAPIDNKNLMEDSFEDEVFADFYWARGHRDWKARHLVGKVKTDNYEALVDVKWNFGENSIAIQVLAVERGDDFGDVEREVLDHYEQVFKAWECPENETLRVESHRSLGILHVNFYFESE